MQATLRIERYADQGRCVGHLEGRVVFVRFALPGELVRIELDEPYDREDRFWTGEVVEVLEASEHRTTPPWQLAGPLADDGGVGGADLIHVDLPGQLEWKSTTVAEQMNRLGHIAVEHVPIRRIEDDDELGGLHWRTRIEMIADEEGKPSMHRRGTHTRVAIHDMPLASRAVLAVCDYYHVWDSEYEPGAQIRVAVPEPRRIDTNTASEREIIEAVGKNYAIVVDGKLRGGSQVLNESIHVGDQVFQYHVDASGFWQMHRKAPIALVNHVLQLLASTLNNNERAVLWDLYSGSGLFTIPLAKCVARRTRVLSVEGSKRAVKQAIHNVSRAKLSNIEALSGDVAKTLTRVAPEFAHPNAVILDPPRAGAKAQVCRQIAQSGARCIIYVACDPASLARDSATLVSQGYELTDITAFDIYPMTHHVETVALFVRS